MVQQLFTEKYRPKTMEDMILPKRIMDFAKSGEIHQNLLFYGPAGLGKTSLAKVMCGYNQETGQYEKYPTLYINVSDETGVDVIREKISMWCGASSIMGGKDQVKIVFLDEMDGASDQFYKALRATIEKYAHLARFVGTCNYVNKLPDPILSRFESISFDFASKEEEKEVFKMIAKRTHAIMKENGISIEMKALGSFVKKNFPDMRRILNKVQSWNLIGITKVELEDIKQLNYSYSEVFKLMCNSPDPNNNYKFLVSNYSAKVDELLASIGTEFPEYLRENSPELESKLPMVIMEVAKHQAQRVHVIDPVITMLSCVMTIQSILNK